MYALLVRHLTVIRSFQPFSLLFFPFALFDCLYYIVSDLHGFSFHILISKHSRLRIFLLSKIFFSKKRLSRSRQ